MYPERQLDQDMPLSLLFKYRRVVQQPDCPFEYDSSIQMNRLKSEDGGGLAIEAGTLLRTNSKTLQAPRDDDPDPGRSDLY